MPTNLLLSAGSGAVGFVVANWEPILSIAIPLALFVVGKGIDVMLQLHKMKKQK
jgi:hypothetical protein